MKEKQKIIEISGLSVTFEQYDPHSLGRVNLPVITALPPEMRLWMTGAE